MCARDEEGKLHEYVHDFTLHFLLLKTFVIQRRNEHYHSGTYLIPLQIGRVADGLMIIIFKKIPKLAPH